MVDRFFKLSVLLFVIHAVFGPSMVGADPEVELNQKIHFSVPVDKYLFNTQLLKDHPQANGKVELTLPGRWFDPMLKLEMVSKESATYGTVQDAIRAGFSAMKAMDIEWIKKGFVNGEATELESVLKDPDTAARIKALNQDKSSIYLNGIVEYKDFRVVVVAQTEDSPVTPFSFQLTPEGWKQTNALAADEGFSIILSALLNGQVNVVQP